MASKYSHKNSSISTRKIKTKFSSSNIDELSNISILPKKTRKNPSSRGNHHTKNLEIITIRSDEQAAKYDALNSENIEKHRILPDVWELPNRKRFYDWVQNMFKQYELGSSENNKLAETLKSPAIFRKNRRFPLNNTQQLIRDFLTGNSPYRGMLLFYALGVGKTCSGIAVSESIQTLKEVLFVSKAALDPNFRTEITSCGADYMTFSNYWVFSRCSTDVEIELANKMGISADTIRQNGGAFFIDFARNISTGSNYDNLSKLNKDKLRVQIEEMINKRFKFLHYDSSRIAGQLTPELFSNKVVIIDEVHNLVNRMASGREIGNRFYQCMMDATNCKYVFLSGTPLINRVYESTVIFNILRGYMPYVEARVKSSYDTEIDYAKIKFTLSQNQYVDQVIINKTAKTVKVTRNPHNFITKSGVKSATKDDSDNSGAGVVYKPKANITDEEFKTQVERALGNLGYNVIITEGKETCLPVDEKEFEQLFYNPDLNKLKKVDLFKRRIAGLTSYYEYQDPTIFPKISAMNILQVPMSEFQFKQYCEFRHTEIMKDKKRKNKPKNDDQSMGSYRLASRFTCTFAFPEEIGSPLSASESGANELLRKLEEKIDELEDWGNTPINKKEEVNSELDNVIVLSNKDIDLLEDTVDTSDTEDDKEILDKELSPTNANNIRKSIKKVLEKTTGNDLAETVELTEVEALSMLKKQYYNVLDKHRDKYLDMNNGSLDKFSPKYKLIIKNILRSPGKVLVYSQFKNLIGLNTFALALEQTGEYIKLELRKVNGVWEMVEHKDDLNPSKRLKRYLFYTGNEDAETREIYRLIYNSDWAALDTLKSNCDTLKQQLRAMANPKRDNLYGEIVQILMTTKTGAEGLNLKQVRQVHVMEPYWQPVLIDQVIGRARRSGSHLALPENERDVEVFIYMATITPDQVKDIHYVDIRQDICKFPGDKLGKYKKVITSDEYLYIVAERKKEIINECQKLMKETAFDCTLSYKDNRLSPGNSAIMCVDYATNNREDYLSTPHMDDTIESLEYNQYVNKSLQYTAIKYKGVMYYYNTIPDSKGKLYLYDESVVTRVRVPKPVGIVEIRNGVKKFAFFPDKSKKKSHSKSQSKSHSK